MIFDNSISVFRVAGYWNTLDAGRRFRAEEGAKNSDECRCQCLPHLTSFREDLNICVDDIHGE